MQISPRYEGPPIVMIDGPADDQLVPLVRQRRRLAELLAGLSDEQWASPSRCDGWSMQDVIAHLIGTNMFWAASIGAGAAGTPTRFLATFDPVATPAQMVAPMRVLSPAAILGQFEESNEAIFDAVAALDDAGWAALGEAPVGHVSIRAVAHHAIWDAWVHERDIALPLGLVPDEEPDEITSCLRYVAALAPALGHPSQPERRGALVIDATDPDIHVVVEVGESVVVHGGPAPGDAARLEGRAVDLIDALSIRSPLAQPVAERDRWLLGGLATAFDTSVDLA